MSNNAMDDEHVKLHHMLNSLKAVIARGGSPAIIREAVEVLAERLALHFQEEERVAPKANAPAVATLREDHKALLQAFDKVRASIEFPIEQRQRAMQDFLAALDKHDREVDMPLFGRG